MELIQIFLPLYDQSGKAFSARLFDEVRVILLRKFGGVTFYRRSASGLWQKESGGVDSDALAVVEVHVKRIRRKWWTKFRASLEHQFMQEKILIRSMKCTEL